MKLHDAYTRSDRDLPRPPVQKQAVLLRGGCT